MTDPRDSSHQPTDPSNPGQSAAAPGPWQAQPQPTDSWGQSPDWSQSSGSWSQQPGPGYPQTGEFSAGMGAWPTPPAAPAPKAATPWWRRPRNLIIGAAVLAAAIVLTFLVIPGDPGVKTKDGDVTNAAEFLATVSGDWQGALPDKGLTKADDAQCYYLVNEKTEEVNEQIACGPVRRPEKSTDEVWDITGYEVERSASDRLKANYFELNADKSQKLPAGTILVTGEGAQAEIDGKDLEEPTIPQADPDIIWDTGSYTVESQHQGAAVPAPGDLTIAGFGTTYTVASITEYTQVTVSDVPYVPADGQKFYEILITEAGGPNNLSGTQNLKITNNEKSLGVPADVTKMMVSSSGSGTALVLDTAGKTQTLDLWTAQRTGDPGTEFLYTDGSPIPHPGTTFSTSGPEYELTLTVDKLTTVPYSESEWAPDGQQFITMEISSSAVTTSSAYGYYNITCDATTIDGGTVTCDGGNFGAATLTGTVPAGVPALSMNFNSTMMVGISQYTYGADDGTPVPMNPVVVSLAL